MIFARIAPLIIFPVLAPAIIAQSQPRTQTASAHNEKTVRLDADGDPLPPGAIARLGTRRWRIGECPLLFSTDGRFAIAVGYKPWLIDPASGKIGRGLDVTAGMSSPTPGAFLTPDNKVLLFAGYRGEDCGLYFLDVETGKELRRVPFDEDGFPRACSWSGDGKRMACWHQKLGTGTGHIAVWDLDSGKEMRRWDKLRGGLALAPDGKMLAVRTDRHIVLLDVVDGKELRRWESPNGSGGDTGANKRFVFSPDGKIIASAEQNRVTLWDPDTGKPITNSPALSTKEDSPVALAFSRDGRCLAAGCSKGGLYAWDLAAGKLVCALADAGRGLPIYVLSFTADGKRLISQAHWFPSARLWDVASGKELSPARANATKVDAVTFSPDGKTIATIGPSDPVSLWDARSGKLLRRFPIHSYLGHIGSDIAPVFLPGGKSMAASVFHYLSVWNLEDGNLRYPSKGKAKGNGHDDQQPLLFAQCSVDDDTFVAVFPGEVERVLDQGRQGRVEIRSAMIGLFDIRTGKIVRSFRTEADQYLRHLRLSPERRTLIGITNEGIFAWDLPKGVELFRLPMPEESIASITFSADGRTLFLTCFRPVLNDHKYTFHLYEMASGKKRATFEYKVATNLKTCSAIAGERLVAITQEDKIQLIDLLTTKELGRFKSDGPWIDCLAFAPDGKTLATGSADTTALIWDISRFVAAPQKVELAKDDLAKHWANLLNDDAEVAFRSIRVMSQAPEETVAFLKGCLQPVPPVPREKIARLIDQLDSQVFAERKKATDELLALGEAAEAALAGALKKPASLEAGRRAEEILRKSKQKRTQGPWTLSGEPLRTMRGVEILERIGTADATEFVTRLAKGSAYALVTREAQASLQRLAKRMPAD